MGIECSTLSDCNRNREPAGNPPVAAAATGDAAAVGPYTGGDPGRSLVRLLSPRGVTGQEVAAADFALHRERQARRRDGE